MSTTSNPVPSIRHPVRRSMRFLRFSQSDLVWTTFCGVITIFVVALAGDFKNLVGAIAIVFWAMTMVVPEGKRDERIYQMPLSVITDTCLLLKKGRIWSQSMREPRGKRQIKPFPLEVREFGDTGLIYNQSKQTYSLIITSEGSTVSSLSMLGQYHAVNDLAALIGKAAAAAGRGGLKIAMGVRARPQDPWLIPNMLNQVSTLDILLPKAVVNQTPEHELTDRDRREMRLYSFTQAFNQIADVSTSVDMILVVTVKDTDEFRRAFKEGVMYEKDMRGLTISRIQHVVIPYLTRLIGPVTVLNGERAERYLRKAWDVTTINGYYDMAQRRALEDDQDESLIQYLPASTITAGSNYVEIDNTFATTLKITSFPKDVFAHQGSVLYDSAAPFSSISMIGETVHSGREYNIVNTLSGLITDVGDAAGVVRSGPRSERRESERTERLKEMDEAVYNQDFVPVIAILASSKEELEDEYRLEADRLTAAGFGHMRVTGRSKQLSSFLTATTLIDLE